jgi:hypothetical protein
MKKIIPTFWKSKDDNKKMSFSEVTVLSEDDYDHRDGSVTPPPKRNQPQQPTPHRRSYPATKKICVSFHFIQVREYDRVLGDWWDVSNGLAIGWNYIQHEPLLLPKVGKETVDHYTKRNHRRLQNFVQRLRSTTTRTKMAVSFHEKPRSPSSATVGLKIPTLSFRESSPQTSPSTRNNNYDKNPTTSSQRFESLLQFGFSSEELERAESLRERARFEKYLMEKMPNNTNFDCE